jgi:hypothetical protein
MTEMVMTSTRSQGSIADTALKIVGRFWFAVAAIGQLVFVLYIFLFYGSASARGDFAAWNGVMPKGYVSGDTVGNVALGVHLLLAFYITLAGLLQLIPQVRTNVPVVHRWNGRLFMLAAFTISIIGLYLIWVRGGAAGDVSQHLGTTLNAVLILLCAGLALRYAIARDIKTHRRWALRLFLVVNGVWFFRVGLMLWIFIHQAPVGFDGKTFTGPFLTALAFAQTLLPLAVLELYLRTQDRKGAMATAAGRITMAAVLFVLTVAMAVGISAATMIMWRPHF